MSDLTPRINKIEDPSLQDDAIATQLGLKSYTIDLNAEAPDCVIDGRSGNTISDVNYGKAFPYLTQDGTWRLKFFVDFDKDSNGVADFVLSGITVPAGFKQVISNDDPNRSASRYDPATGSGQFVVRYSVSNNVCYIAGDIELSSKPSWAI